MREVLAVMNALADENRVRLLMSLSDHELCVCQLVDFIGLADSTVSKHMSILRDAGLVQSRKRGRWVYYRLAGGDASPFVQNALSLVRGSLSKDAKIGADGARLQEIISRYNDSSCRAEAGSYLAKERDAAVETV
jgi:DNA-binding transcriptional ArsR family regulator